MLHGFEPVAAEFTTGSHQVFLRLDEQLARGADAVLLRHQRRCEHPYHESHEKSWNQKSFSNGHRNVLVTRMVNQARISRGGGDQPRIFQRLPAPASTLVL